MIPSLASIIFLLLEITHYTHSIALPQRPYPPQTTSTNCPIFERGILNNQFEDLPLDPSPFVYKDFTFGGTLDWAIVPSTRDPIPMWKGITSEPNGVLSTFHSMTFFGSSHSFTFDLLALNVTGLTALPRTAPMLRLRLVGYRAGMKVASTSLRIRNAYSGGGPVLLKLGGREWAALDNVGIVVEDEKAAPGVPKPEDRSPGFVLDDIVYQKRTVGC